MRLVEPMKSGFQTIAPRGGNKTSSKKGFGSGKETLRFKANGNAAIEDEVCELRNDDETFLMKIFSLSARRHNSRRDWFDQRSARLLLWYQWQRAGGSNLGLGRQQDQLDGLCRSDWQFRLGSVWIHRRFHHRFMGSDHRHTTGKSQAVERKQKISTQGCTQNLINFTFFVHKREIISKTSI